MVRLGWVWLGYVRLCSVKLSGCVRVGGVGKLFKKRNIKKKYS